MQGVVVEEEQPLSADPPTETQRVRERRVTPTQVVGVFGVGVLAIVDQERCFSGQIEARYPFVVAFGQLGAQPGLVVGDVTEDVVPVLDPVAERRATVFNGLGSYPGSAELPFAGPQTTISHSGLKSGAKNISPWM